LPSVGCQVEYAGMTLPSGKYMHDDVQYFPAGPEFPWANTQAATQRARMRAMGIEPPAPPPAFIQPGAGATPPLQNLMGRPQNINAGPLGAQPDIGAPVPAPPPPGLGPGGAAVTPPPPGGAVPPPPPPGGGPDADAPK
jgi:hypothetical protein